MVSFLKISPVVVVICIATIVATNPALALSIDGTSSSYQITGDVQNAAPILKPAAPKAPVVQQQVPVAPKSKVTNPSVKSVSIPKQQKDTKKISVPVIHAAAPDGRATGTALDRIVQTIHIQMKNLDILPTIRSSLTKIAETTQAFHASAADSINPNLLSLLQMISIAAFIMFAFGLGFISAPLKR